MTDSEARSSSSANVAEGFSQRFNILMDRARLPKQNRITVGAKRFDVALNTFKSWCTADKLPGTHSLLVEVVNDFLKDIPGRHNPRAVVAWLIAGDAVPHPFEEGDELALVELYLQISKVAKAEGIDFESLPRKVRNLVIRRARDSLPSNTGGADREPVLDDATLSMVVGMLETARTMG